MATLRDIASRLDISQAVVSRVLNGKSDVWASEQTRQRIFDTARELNYRPSLMGRALSTGKTMQIAVALSQRGWANFAEGKTSELQGLAGVVGAARYSLVLTPGHSGDHLEMDDVPGTGACDGVCVFASEASASIYRALTERALPFVVLGNAGNDSLPQVDHDHRARMIRSVDWLAEQGHRRILLAHPAASHPLPPHRVILDCAYRDAMQKLGDGFEAILSRNTNLKAEEILAQFRLHQPTAIVARSIPTVLTWRAVLSESGVSVPGDATILAHISKPEREFLERCHQTEGLAFHLHDPHEIGRRAGTLLTDWIGGTKPPREPVLVPTLEPDWR